MPNGNWLQRSAYEPLARKHVAGPRWAVDQGTDFWVIQGATSSEAASTATIEQLVEGGWVATSLVQTAGSAADFMASADKGVPLHMLTNAQNDLLKSPVIFGNYTHAWQAMRIMGYNALPVKLVAEFWGAMTVHSADDPIGGWGFFEDGGSPIVANDNIAFISTDGTNFRLAANGGAGALTDLGAADDALWHLFTIELFLGSLKLAYWYIDGAVQGSVAITDDEFPIGFGFGAGGATNFPGLGDVHLYYSWQGVGRGLGTVPTSPPA